MIKALLLDLDNTLIDRDEALLGWLRQALPSEVCSEQNLRALVECDRGGYGSKHKLFARFSELARVSRESVRRAFLRDFPGFARLKPDADGLLRAFPGPVVVVTNGPSAFQRKKLAAAGLLERVEHVLVSSECGVRKPHGAIFRRALALAGCSAEQALMIGDHPRHDIAGARDAGISGVWVRTRWFEAPAGTPSVHSLQEVSW